MSEDNKSVNSYWGKLGKRIVVCVGIMIVLIAGVIVWAYVDGRGLEFPMEWLIVVGGGLAIAIVAGFLMGLFLPVLKGTLKIVVSLLSTAVIIVGVVVIALIIAKVIKV